MLLSKILPNIFSWGKEVPPQKKEPSPITTVAASIFDKLATQFAPLLNLLKYSVYQGFWKNADQWVQNLQNLSKIGGEHTLLPSPDGATVSATYLSADTFRQKIAEAGGKQALITANKQEFRGLAFSSGQHKEFLNALRDLTFFEQSRYCWTEVTDGKSVYLFSTEDANRMKKAGLLSPNNELVHNAKVTTSAIDLSKKTEATAILCPGIKGRKESHGNIRDMASYLLLGMNVMMFDYRGTAGSRGFISQKGLKMDLESIYGYLRKEKRIPAEKMVVVGTCFGAGPATELATTHPVHLLLNQPFAQAQRFVNDRIDQGREEQMVKLPKMLQMAYFNAMGFDYDIPRLLKEAKGHIGLIVNTTDDEVAADQDDLLLASFDNENQKVKPITVAGIEHAAGWNAIPAAQDRNDRPYQLKDGKSADLAEELAKELNSEEFRNFGKLQVVQFLQGIGLTKGELLQNLGTAPAA